MKNQFIKTMAVLVACLVSGAQAQTGSSQSGSSSSDSYGSPSSSSSSQDPSSSGSSSSSSGLSGSSSSSSGLSGSSSSHGLSATGRSSGQQALRATKLTGAQVQSSSGSTIGTINDVVINPMSGKVDFAVIQLSSTAGSDTSSSTSTSGSSITTTGSKLVPVPWKMLTASSSGSSQGQQTFTFQGDQSKLASAPSFSQTQWPDVNQSSWRQSVYSHFGVSSGSAMGGSESPGSSSSGFETESSGGATSPGSSSDPSSPGSSSDPSSSGGSSDPSSSGSSSQSGSSGSSTL